VKVLYFGKFREQMKRAEESVDLPQGDQTVASLVRLLRARGGDWSEVLSDSGTVLVAVNQRMGAWETPVTDSDEVAFFPPVTGG